MALSQGVELAYDEHDERPVRAGMKEEVNGTIE
jgi:hypothetical protein